MSERRMVLFGYGFVLSVASVAICQAYPTNRIDALCFIVISASVASTITIVVSELLWTSKRR